MKYNGFVPVKATKAADVKEQYVPQDFRSYYDSILLAADASSETDDNDD